MKAKAKRRPGPLDRYREELRTLSVMLGVSADRARHSMRRARAAILAADRQLRRRRRSD